MGTIFRKRGSWYIDFRLSGKRYRQKIGSEADARKALNDLEMRIERGEAGIVDNRVRFDDLAEKFMRFHRSEVRDTTYARSEGLLRNLRREFAGRRISEMSLDEVDEYCERRLSKGDVRRRTVNMEVGFLKQMLKYGIERRLIASSPVEAWKAKKETDKRKSRALEPDEVRLLLDHATDAMRPVWLTLLKTGMRRGELVNLRWSDVDLGRGVIHIRCRDDWKTKNGEDRDIDISEATDLWVELRRLRLAAKPKAEYVFTTEQGTQRLHNLIRQLRGTARRAGIEGADTLTVHSLRHTVATEFARQNVHPSVAQGVLGHKDPKVTLKYYTHMNAKDRRMAVGKLTYGTQPESDGHRVDTSGNVASQETVG